MWKLTLRHTKNLNHCQNIRVSFEFFIFSLETKGRGVFLLKQCAKHGVEWKQKPRKTFWFDSDDIDSPVDPNEVEEVKEPREE